VKITRRELDKHIKVTTKDIIKKYGYKMRGSVLYKKSGDYFISILLVATGVNNNLINARGNVKPYFLDDVFWEVFKMPENLKEPIGLRANGAFTIKGLQVYNQHKKVECYEDVKGYVEELLKECDSEIEAVINKGGSNFRKFIDYSKSVENPGLYKPELAEMLLDIKEKNYQVAKKLASHELENQRYGNLENKGKDIYQHVVDFCENKY